MKTKKNRIDIVKEIICSEDETHTYELSIEINNPDSTNDKTAVVICLYPVQSKTKNFINNDSTINHLLKHSQELGVNKLRIINIYSKVVLTRMSSRGLQVDSENMKYITEQVYPSLDSSHDLVIIAWGNSLSSSESTNRSKRQLCTLLEKYPEVYHITPSNTSQGFDIIGAHILYMGIRYNTSWTLTRFPFKEVMKAIPDKKPSAKPKQTRKPKES